MLYLDVLLHMIKKVNRFWISNPFANERHSKCGMEAEDAFALSSVAHYKLYHC